MSRATIWKQKRKLVGGCVMCLKDAVPGKTLCAKHAAYQARRYRSNGYDPRYVRVERFNLCSGYTFCMVCRVKCRADLCDKHTAILRRGCEQRRKEIYGK